MKKIIVLSHQDFNDLCKSNSWSDDNIESLSNLAFISIVGTPEVTEALSIKMTKHWFKEDHSNVLNLDFDDVSEDDVIRGIHVKAISPEDSKRTVEFIERNKDRSFYIHCLAGVSRSRGIAKFIEDNFDDFEVIDNGHARPNPGVLGSLNHILWERYFSR